MIRFFCEHCAHKIRVHDKDVGKHGKCPKCKNVVVVPTLRETPAKSAKTSTFTCSMCEEQIDAPEGSRGRLIECPHCGCYVEAPIEQISAEEPKAPAQKRKEDVVDGLSLEERLLLDGEIRVDDGEQTGERKLPWLADIFLYPTTTSGMIHIVIFAITPMLISLLSKFIRMHVLGIGFVLPALLSAILIAYWFYYFSECVRDSARGGVRTPDTFGGTLGKDEMIEQYLTLFACYAFFFGPAIFYHSYAHFSNTQVDNTIFWPLLAYGLFFFPMGILAVIMFDSINGLNPILLIRSIAHTFFQYCGLVIFFAGLGMLRIMISIVWAGQPWRFPVTILCNIISVWLFFVAAHLIGRFYWRYQDKLYWEV